MHLFLRRALLPVLAVIAVAGGASTTDEPLIPLNAFFAHPSASWDYRVSPDGTRLAWIANKNGRATLHFRRLDETTARSIKTPREARAPWPGGESFRWSRDGKRLLLLMDSNGDENANLFAVDVEAAEPVARNLTPLDGVRVELVGTSNEDPNIAIVRHTGRTGRMFDLLPAESEHGRTDDVCRESRRRLQLVNLGRRSRAHARTVPPRRGVDRRGARRRWRVARSDARQLRGSRTGFSAIRKTHGRCLGALEPRPQPRRPGADRFA